MKLLVDTDAFCKLGVTELLQDAADILGVPLEEWGRLSALPYMLRKGTLPRLYGAKACEALIPVADAIPLVEQASVIWLDKLTPIDAIDPGEAQIFAAAAESGLIVISGDKRALHALKDIEGFAEGLAGRIVVMEAVLMVLCEQLGDEKIRRQIAPLAASDRVLGICFSEENRNPRDALLSYYNALASDVEPLVLWNPQVRGQS